ncbi:asparagine synthase-related protein [Ornithinimicrobium sp. Y1847]|uniref:asparagine synthase-related protein n=1 Tax=Ornithinimicrobium sp. Y1847 TaxID=3405419 RepID=UPI003B678E73
MTALASSYGEYEHLLFDRGYLLSRYQDGEPVILQRLGWENVRLGEWTLAHSRRIDLAQVERGGARLVLLGWGCSVEIDSVDGQEIAHWLADADQDDEFQRRVNSLIGRFAVLRLGPEGVRVQQDGLGLRGVYYSAAQYPTVVGSHAHLVGEVIGTPPSAWARPTFTKETNLRSAPGRQTTRNGVLALTPNTELDLSSRALQRILPVEQRVEAGRMPEVMTQIREIVERGIDLLAAGPRPLVISLSAGIDSRLTLALARRNVQRITWFTYELAYQAPTSASEHDATTGEWLAENLGLHHRPITINSPEVPVDFSAVLMANRFRAHSVALAHAYLKKLPTDALHLRSSGYGISGAFYLTHGFPNDEVDPQYRMHLASFLKCTDPHVHDAFVDLSDATSFDAIKTHGYDPLDFQRWEYREGVWLQSTLQESDPSSETGILFGSRQILTKLLSLPFQDRATYRHFIWLLQEAWPELLDIPINGRDYSAIELSDLSWSPGDVVQRERPPLLSF